MFVRLFGKKNKKKGVPGIMPSVCQRSVAAYACVTMLCGVCSAASFI